MQDGITPSPPASGFWPCLSKLTTRTHQTWSRQKLHPCTADSESRDSGVSVASARVTNLSTATSNASGHDRRLCALDRVRWTRESLLAGLADKRTGNHPKEKFRTAVSGSLKSVPNICITIMHELKKHITKMDMQITHNCIVFFYGRNSEQFSGTLVIFDIVTSSTQPASIRHGLTPERRAVRCQAGQAVAVIRDRQVIRSVSVRTSVSTEGVWLSLPTGMCVYRLRRRVKILLLE